MSKLQADPQLECNMRALELYTEVRNLDAQRQSNSLKLMAAAGALMMMSGAARVGVKSTTLSVVLVIFGGLAELCALRAYVRSS